MSAHVIPMNTNFLLSLVLFPTRSSLLGQNSYLKLGVRDRVSHPYKTSIVDFYLMIAMDEPM